MVKKTRKWFFWIFFQPHKKVKVVSRSPPTHNSLVDLVQRILCSKYYAIKSRLAQILVSAFSFGLHFPAILNLPNIQVEQGRELLRLLKPSKNTLSHDISTFRTQPSDFHSMEKLYEKNFNSHWLFATYQDTVRFL